MFKARIISLNQLWLVFHKQRDPKTFRSDRLDPANTAPTATRWFPPFRLIPKPQSKHRQTTSAITKLTAFVINLLIIARLSLNRGFIA